ncbi:glutamate racemase [Paenibacillus sedimenti]|uniref:Glutamate racemase n=1 Tax=Paenibacillus sedimenti TaxID=2770274 RepID=A0A926KNJ5_9BACL|nr:glutamate racemase [Paenibacillus sedimenti]MBD0380236.1 glutamate racemase [Paenibacillus sedimenti]
MRIAFFDSGIGGISVLAEAMKRLPKEDFLYFADTLHVPYGTKSKEEVKSYIQEAAVRIMKENVKALVIACNTATSIAVTDLRSAYDVPIIGMEPAVKPAVEMNRFTGKRVLVFATALTLKQTKYSELISRVDDQSIVDSLPLPELVEYCEKLVFNENVLEDYFTNKLSGFDLSMYGTVVLGCTHYPFYRNVLKTLLPDHIQIVDGSAGTVSRLSHILKDKDQYNSNGQSNVKFLCSSDDLGYIQKMERALERFQSMN